MTAWFWLFKASHLACSSNLNQRSLDRYISEGVITTLLVGLLLQGSALAYNTPQNVLTQGFA